MKKILESVQAIIGWLLSKLVGESGAIVKSGQQVAGLNSKQFSQSIGETAGPVNAIQADQINLSVPVTIISTATATASILKLEGPSTTAEEIRMALDKVSPYQRELIRSHYIGQILDEEGSYWSADPGTNGMVKVSMWDRKRVQWISVQVLLTDHPEFQTLEEGRPMHVRGKIKRNCFDFIELEDAIVRIEPKEPLLALKSNDSPRT